MASLSRLSIDFGLFYSSRFSFLLYTEAQELIAATHTANMFVDWDLQRGPVVSTGRLTHSHLQSLRTDTGHFQLGQEPLALHSYSRSSIAGLRLSGAERGQLAKKMLFSFQQAL